MVLAMIRHVVILLLSHQYSSALPLLRLRVFFPFDVGDVLLFSLSLFAGVIYVLFVFLSFLDFKRMSWN